MDALPDHGIVIGDRSPSVTGGLRKLTGLPFDSIGFFYRSQADRVVMATMSDVYERRAMSCPLRQIFECDGALDGARLLALADRSEEGVELFRSAITPFVLQAPLQNLGRLFDTEEDSGAALRTEMTVIEHVNSVLLLVERGGGAPKSHDLKPVAARALVCRHLFDDRVIALENPKPVADQQVLRQRLVRGVADSLYDALSVVGPVRSARSDVALAEPHACDSAVEKPRSSLSDVLDSIVSSRYTTARELTMANPSLAEKMPPDDFLVRVRVEGSKRSALGIVDSLAATFGDKTPGLRSTPAIDVLAFDELCTELYDMLGLEGRVPSRRVGSSLAVLTVQDESSASCVPLLINGDSLEESRRVLLTTSNYESALGKLSLAEMAQVLYKLDSLADGADVFDVLRSAIAERLGLAP